MEFSSTTNGGFFFLFLGTSTSTPLTLWVGISDSIFFPATNVYFLMEACGFTLNANFS